MFENMVLRRISGLQRVEVIEGWTELQNEECYDLDLSPYIIRMIKSRR
jgi:hypothetical protein